MTAHVDRNRFDPEVVRHIGRLDFASRMIATGLFEGLRRSRRHGFSSEFSDFAPYVHGDDIRLLDWRVYARSNRLYVRRYEAEADMAHVLILDASASMAWQWKDEVTKLQYAANLLAAIAHLCVSTGDRVALMAHDSRQLHSLPPRCGPAQLDRLFSVLESLSPGGGGTLSQLAESALATTRHRAVFVVCSDLEEPDDEVAAALEVLSGVKGRVCLLHLLDRREEEYPFGDATHLRDSETDELIPVDPSVARKSHAREVEAFRASRMSRCNDYGVEYQPVNTGMNYVDVLLEAAAK
jgi:uncharacterized protein (DUF58 family)